MADAPLEYWDEAHTYIARKLIEVCVFVPPPPLQRCGGHRELLTHLPTLVPEFNNDKNPKVLYVKWKGGYVDLLSNLCSLAQK